MKNFVIILVDYNLRAVYYVGVFWLFRSHHPLRHAKSFKFAFKGIFHALINEPNFRIQILIALYAVFMGIFFKISGLEWAILVLTMGLLLSAEMINTVVEEIMDYLFPEQHDIAKVIKDLAAGFVLVISIAALIILVLIFGQDTRDLMVNYHKGS